ncbi:mechanosensitive ion channel family protein [Novosphingopyxis sp. YJ-S2-01]|uniref:mechanosensitive ion channel family protein n=1 Tax=Novosphingopyxis sp. YJ-S2-01 TaxID=2794021 RepID=UPI0018DD3037|nr:mechanosensitive ion channel family protein [Novosphingopyxis sp. YJ-S2-01]MBH9538864.1 mechanosensitive ion channel family protein [Novosphingopyxis sp. YJ-S2-01]|tara:strand:- start:2884 stop:3798 length:915 start_codon:yes stop_codon:yes gene_type:complete
MGKATDQFQGPVQSLLEQLSSMADGFFKLLPLLAIALIVVFITWMVAKGARKIADRVTAKTEIRPSLKALVDTLVTIFVWVVGLMIAATIILPGLTPASLLAGLGIGAVAIGFAFQDIFENFLAGVLIMIRKKMRIGDVISCEGIEGRVEHITLRETHVRRLSNEVTIVPNSMLFKNPVQILTDDAERRHEVVVGVSYDTDLEEAREVILKAVEDAEGVNTEKRIDIFAFEFGDSSINFRVRWWAGSKPLAMHQTRDTVVRSVKRALDNAGIEIPFPYITHTFKEPVPLARNADNDAEAPSTGD